MGVVWRGVCRYGGRTKVRVFWIELRVTYTLVRDASGGFVSFFLKIGLNTSIKFTIFSSI